MCSKLPRPKRFLILTPVWTFTAKREHAFGSADSEVELPLAAAGSHPPTNGLFEMHRISPSPSRHDYDADVFLDVVQASKAVEMQIPPPR